MPGRARPRWRSWRRPAAPPCSCRSAAPRTTINGATPPPSRRPWAAEVVDERELSDTALGARVLALAADDGRRAALAAASRKLARPTRPAPSSTGWRVCSRRGVGADGASSDRPGTSVHFHRSRGRRHERHRRAAVAPRLPGERFGSPPLRRYGPVAGVGRARSRPPRGAPRRGRRRRRVLGRHPRWQPGNGRRRRAPAVPLLPRGELLAQLAGSKRGGGRGRVARQDDDGSHGGAGAGGRRPRSDGDHRRHAARRSTAARARGRGRSSWWRRTRATVRSCGWRRKWAVLTNPRRGASGRVRRDGGSRRRVRALRRAGARRRLHRGLRRRRRLAAPVAAGAGRRGAAGRRCPDVRDCARGGGSLRPPGGARSVGASTCRVRIAGREAAEIDLRLAAPGAHNLRNALAALAVGAHFGVPPQAAADALAHFPRRRATPADAWRGWRRHGDRRLRPPSHGDRSGARGGQTARPAARPRGVSAASVQPHGALAGAVRRGARRGRQRAARGGLRRGRGAPSRGRRRRRWPRPSAARRGRPCGWSARST